MIKTSKQLKDLVGNRAHGDSAKSMLLLRNYAMERFLERLSASKYRNCFILKGGMLISAMVGIDSRATMDIDTTLRNYPLNCESAEQIVRQIADVEIDDKISFVIKKAEEIMEDSEYQGVRLSLDAYLDKTRIPLKIDISTGDVITPCENRTIPLLAYPPETVLAEKLETILSRGEANTRLRDFYDVYILQREDFVVTPDALCHALLATCRKRGHEDLLHTYASILDRVRQSDTMRTQWMKYQSDFDYAAGITWDTVLDTVETLCMKTLDDHAFGDELPQEESQFEMHLL